jgi:hypothetical protein
LWVVELRIWGLGVQIPPGAPSLSITYLGISHI